MSEEKSGKHSFICGACRWVIRLLPSPEILVHGAVKPNITRRCKACEGKGRVSKGKKQIFYHTPDAPEPAREELVPALEKYL